MNSTTKLCCLLGNPVEHSISPLIHNTLAEKMNINIAYTAFKVESSELNSAVKGAKALGVLGMNVTVPHKCDVIESLDDIDSLASKIGAATLTKAKGLKRDTQGVERPVVQRVIFPFSSHSTTRELVV